MCFNRLFKIYVLILLLSGIMSCKDDFADSPYPDISCTQIASLPAGGRASSVAFVIEGKGYVALGRNSTSNGYVQDCWQYNPETNSWMEMTPFPGEARGRAIAQVVDSIAYVGLGYGGSAVYQNTGYYTDFWAFSPKKNEWTRKADYPTAYGDACVSFVYNHRIYVGNGFDGHTFSLKMWVYDPSTDKWSEINEIGTKTRATPVLTFNGDKAYFGTGFNAYNYNDWWEYTPSSEAWKKLSAIPDKGRINALAFSVGKRVFVGTGRYFAGSVTPGAGVKDDILEYDVNKDQWYHRGNIPLSGRENAIAFVINGKVYLGLGENDSDVLSDMWSFEP